MKFNQEDFELDSAKNSDKHLGGCDFTCNKEAHYKTNGRCDYCGGFCCGLASNPLNKCPKVFTDYLNHQPGPGLQNGKKQNLNFRSFST